MKLLILGKNVQVAQFTITCLRSIGSLLDLYKCFFCAYVCYRKKLIHLFDNVAMTVDNKLFMKTAVVVTVSPQNVIAYRRYTSS
jgi:hypothetical protein